MAVTMPVLDWNKAVDGLSEADAALVRACEGRGGRLRTSKPTKNGEAAYVWRMIAFFLIKSQPYSCMPMTADFDIMPPNSTKWDYTYARSRSKELDVVVKHVVDTVPLMQQQGVIRWGRALGAI